MDVELLAPLIPELIEEDSVSEENRDFLYQTGETLSCSPSIVDCLIDIERQKKKAHESVPARLLWRLIQLLDKDAARHSDFIIRTGSELAVPAEVVQTLFQSARQPGLRFLSRVIRAYGLHGLAMPVPSFLEELAQDIGLPAGVVQPLLELNKAILQKTFTQILDPYWQLLQALFKADKLSPQELSYVAELGKELQIPEPISRALQDFMRMRLAGSGELEAYNQLVRTFTAKGMPSSEETQFLIRLGQNLALSQNLVYALIELEYAQQNYGGKFAGAAIVPLIRSLLADGRLDAEGEKLLNLKAKDLRLPPKFLPSLLEFEKNLYEKVQKSPAILLSPLIKSLVQNAQIDEDKVFFLIKKAEEIGASEKVVRSLVQIEIATQRKNLTQEYLKTVPPISPTPPPPSPLLTSTFSPPVSPPPTPPPPSPSPSTVQTQPPAPLSNPPLAKSTTQSFPSGGNFPKIAHEYKESVLFALPSEKYTDLRGDIFVGKKSFWYVAVGIDAENWLFYQKGKSGITLSGLQGVYTSPTGEAIAIRLKSPAGEKVIFNGEDSPVFDSVGALVFSADGKHVAYKALKGEDQFIFLDNVAMGPYLKVGELLFHPTQHTLLFTVWEENKRWILRDFVSNLYGEPLPILAGVTFSSSGNHIAYGGSYKNKIALYVDHAPYIGNLDGVSDIFVTDAGRVAYLFRKGTKVGAGWDKEVLALVDGISLLTLSPSQDSVAYVARIGSSLKVYWQKNLLGTYEKADSLTFSEDGKRLFYLAYHQGKAHLHENGNRISPPMESITSLVMHKDYYAAAAKKDRENYVVLTPEGLSDAYNLIDKLTLSPDGKSVAFVAKKKGGFWGIMWGKTPSDKYEYPQHLTFGDEGKALLFFAKRRDGWYAVLNDQPIPESLCREILCPPKYHAEKKAFTYLMRRGLEVFEVNIALKK
ncbi:MAG: hypothetical protein ACUVRD_00950 [Bacteroidia bacterium]